MTSSRRLLALGDSHARVFQHPHLAKALPGWTIDARPVIGATVSGLANPNSKTQARPQFLQAAQGPADAVATLMGEVDTGFVLWYRAEKYGTAVDEMLELALAQYQTLLGELSTRCPLIVISAPLPTIRDGQTWGEVANERRSIKASQRERTELTLRFNAAMQRHCREHGHDFIDLDTAAMGADGLVSPALLNPKATDHHYATGPYARLIAAQLAPLLQRIAAERS